MQNFFFTQVDLARERCLVNFMDNTSSWSSFKELTKLSMPDSDVMCVLCKKSQPKTDNDIVVCNKCGRGYHQLCHQVAYMCSLFMFEGVEIHRISHRQKKNAETQNI